MSKLSRIGTMLWIFVLLTQPGAAEETSRFYPIETTVVSNCEKLAKIVEQINLKFSGSPRFFLPDEISPSSPVFFSSITDGRDIFKVAVVKPRAPDFVLDEFETTWFRVKLLGNTFFHDKFHKDSIQLAKDGDYLYILSDNFPRERFGDLHLMLHWVGLAARVDVGIYCEHPENMLFPTLPEESSDECEFLKHVRADKTTSGTETFLFGYRRGEDDRYELIYEAREKEGTDVAKMNEKLSDTTIPFAVGGFVGENRLGETCYNIRLLPKEFISFKGRSIELGGTWVPPGERDEPERKYFFRMSIGVTSKQDQKNAGKSYREKEGIVVNYPVQVPELAYDPDALPVELIDQLNADAAQSLADLLDAFRSTIAPEEENRPIDLAVQVSDEHVFVGISFPRGQMEKLLPFVQKFVSSYTTLEDKMAEKSGPGEESGKIIDELSQMHFTLEDLRQNDGITYKIVYVKPEEEQELLPCVIALGQEFFGFAMDLKRYEKIDESPDSKNETSRTGVELLSQQLEEKIAESRRLAEENHPCPETVMRSLSDEMDLQVFNRYEGRDVIYRATWRGILSEPMAQLGKRLGKEFLPSGLTL